MGLRRLRLGSGVRRVGGRQSVAVLYAISAVTDLGGAQVSVAAAGVSTLSGGESITISGTGLYDGTYTAQSPGGGAFTIDAVFAGTATGFWRLT